jgi:UDP-N-acetylmuramate-alanine ligase
VTSQAEDRLTAEDLGHVHLVGIGGVGMSGLARLLLTRGIPVSGSELKEWPALAGLTALGATIHMRHEPSNLDGVETTSSWSRPGPAACGCSTAPRRWPPR